MNIPSQSGQSPTTNYSDYQPLPANRTGKSTFAQTIAQSQSSSLSFTTAEGDLVTLSDLSMSYQQTKGSGWFSPASSGMNVSSLSLASQTMGISVQGDLNDQELADITRMVGELTSIASAFFSGDYETTMAKATDFDGLDLGSISSLSASFSRQSVSQTRIASHYPLPDMADLNDLKTQDLYQKPETDKAGAMDYATVLEARWQQILKAVDQAQEENLAGLFARPLPTDSVDATSIPEMQQTPEADPAPAIPTTTALDQAVIPARDRAALQMRSHMEQLLAKHPGLTPFAKSLADLAMEKAAARTDQPHPATAKAFGELRNAFINQLNQWFFPQEPSPVDTPLTAA